MQIVCARKNNLSEIVVLILCVISATCGAAVDHLSVHRLFFRVTGHVVHVEQVGLGVLVRICNFLPIFILKLTVGLTNSIMGFDIPMYTLMYCPLLYYCFVRDTQAGYAHKLRHGREIALDVDGHWRRRRVFANTSRQRCHGDICGLR